MRVKGQLNEAQAENLSSDPSNLPAGRLWWNTTSDRLKYADDAGAAKELVEKDATQTLTNKTIDGDDNTLQDVPLTAIKTVLADANKVVTRNGSGVIQSSLIVNANIDAAAAIARSKIATGSNSHVIVNDGSGNLSSVASISISQGGTGQSSKAAAFDALSPMTSSGDIIYGGASGTGARLAKGTDGQYLTLSSGVPAWGSVTVSTSVTSKTTTYTATTSDDVILCSGSAFTVTLYTASGNSGRKLVITKTDSSLSNIITIDGNSTETIDGSETTTLNTQYESVTLISDGSNWLILERKIPKAISSSTSISIASTGGGFVKGTMATDSVKYYRDAQYMVATYRYNCTVAGTNGTGTYLITIPGSQSADTGQLTAFTGSLDNAAAMSDSSLEITNHSGYSTAGGAIVDAFSALLYDSTRFRIILRTIASGQQLWGQSHYGSGVLSWAFTVRIPISGWKG